MKYSEILLQYGKKGPDMHQCTNADTLITDHCTWHSRGHSTADLCRQSVQYTVECSRPACLYKGQLTDPIVCHWSTGTGTDTDTVPITEKGELTTKTKSEQAVHFKVMEGGFRKN